MIPVSLSLRNFLSYGEGVPPLDFTNFHVACISGRNGHGKSALLDAVTWALWGEARKASNDRTPNEGLLRTGSTEMQVTFEFKLEAELFRVSRSYRKAHRGSTTNLELQVYSPQNDVFKTLSEAGSIRKTQHQLNVLLRMTYDTFINSAFILQGQANEFTRRSARDRKAILADILGLSRYDDLSGLARAHLQKTDFEIARGREELAEIEKSIGQKPNLQENLQHASDRLVALENRITNSEIHLESLHTEQAKLESYRGELESLRRELKRFETEQADQETQVQIAMEECSTCKEFLSRKEKILHAHKRYCTMQSECTILQQKQQILRPLEIQKHNLEKNIEDKKHEVERRLDELDLHVSQAEREILEAETILKNRADIEAGLESLSKTREKEKAWEDLREQSESTKSKLHKIERIFEATLSKFQVSLETNLEQHRQIENTAQELTLSRQTAADAQKQLQESKNLDQERNQVRESGNHIKLKIETDRSRLNDLKIDRIEIKKQRTALQKVIEAQCPLCGSYLDAKHRSKTEFRLAEQNEDLGEKVAILEQDIQRTESELEQHRRHYQKIKNRLAVLNGAPEKSARAEAALHEAENDAKILSILKVKISTLKEQINETKTSGPEAIALLEMRTQMEAIGYDNESHQALREQLRVAETFEAQKANLQAAENRREKAIERLQNLRIKRDTAVLWIAEKRYAKKNQANLNKVQNEIDSLAYDSSRHDQVMETLETLRDTAGEKERLQATERELSSANKRLQAALARRDLIQVSRIKAQTRISELKTLLKSGETVAEEVKEIQTNIREKRSKRDLLLQERIILETHYNQCEALESSLKKKQDWIKTEEKKARIHRELVTAFGKDGIQALIIEQAIPEIEEETNRILSNLTGNRTQVSLESLRDLKKGGTQETLDIQISDELGERSYELYSGGEAFRIDFAVRIALSKLLASRTGTRLRTLVIDEGFGTQDTEGLDHLVEAIQAISQDFEKILVITHVDSFKDAFPVHIEVTKYPDTGSRFEVLN